MEPQLLDFAASIFSYEYRQFKQIKPQQFHYATYSSSFSMFACKMRTPQKDYSSVLHTGISLLFEVEWTGSCLAYMNQTVAMSDIIQIVASKDFDAETQSGVVLVDFFATWCRPCVMQLPILEKIALEFAGKAKVIKVDTDQSQDIALRFGVSSIPTLVLLKDGEKVSQFVGLQQAETLRAEIAKTEP